MSLVRTGFARKTIPERSRPETVRLSVPVKRAAATYATRKAFDAAKAQEAALPIPKEPRLENRHLLSMAKGEQCLLRVRDVCNGDSETVVACHSNKSAHGKALGMKAHDFYSVWGCSACHRWLDQGQVVQHVKEYIFMRAHALQVQAWRTIADDPREPAKDRAAARWAVEQFEKHKGAQ